MTMYVKKPVVVAAVRASEAIHDAHYNWNHLPQWLQEAYEKGGVVFTDSTVVIGTLEGVMTANKEDWIIRGVKGELYPCKPDIFEATYEPAQIKAEYLKGD